MERKYKFRAKFEDGKWIYFSLLDRIDFELIDIKTISQSTGFTDFNDKEIYEGDVISSFGPVIFQFGKFGFKYEDHPKWFDLSDVDWRDRIITGNIFEIK